MTKAEKPVGEWPVWAGIDSRTIAAVLAATLILMIPALLNGAPFIFLDTQHYFLIGKRIFEILFGDSAAALEPALSAIVAASDALTVPAQPVDQGGLAAIAGGRSPIYSVFIYLISTTLTMWTVAAIQALVCAVLIFRFCAMIWGSRIAPVLVAVSVLTVFSSLGFHATFMMPDVFAGCMVLALAIFLFSPKLGRIEAVLLVGAAFVFATLHTSNMLLVASALIAVVIIRLAERAPLKPLLPRLAAVAGIAVATVAFNFAYTTVVRVVSGDEVRSFPYLTARVLADGPGERYLAAACKDAKTPFAACMYAGKHFESQDSFLSEPSSGGYYAADPATKSELSKQDVRFALAVTLFDAPGQISAAFVNFANAAGNVGVSEQAFGLNIFADRPDWHNSDVLPYVPGGEACIVDSQTCQPKPWTEVWRWEVLILANAALVLFGALAIWLAMISRRGVTIPSESAPALRIAFFLVLLTFANAAICGILSGVHDRYQARLNWTLFLALAAFLPVIRVWLDKRREGATSGTASASQKFSLASSDTRFLVTSIGAFAADLTLALLLREVFYPSVTLSAAISFIVVWFTAYFVHEYWTFKRAESRASAGRLTRNLVANGAALTTRVIVIFALEAIHAPEATFIAACYVIAGAGCSLTVNYVLNRFWVFNRK